jgi:hypothetical protein
LPETGLHLVNLAQHLVRQFEQALSLGGVQLGAGGLLRRLRRRFVGGFLSSAMTAI